MNRSVVCVGEVRVAGPPDEAVALFTPEGERAWVPGWDPAYPAGESDGEAPGTVFVTHAGDHPTTWVIVSRGERIVRYARVTPGVLAGTVTVRCRAEGEATVATVRYCLTALSDAGAHVLAGFAAGYRAMMADWERQIAAALAARG